MGLNPFLIALCYRICIILCFQNTNYHPDEFYQSTEAAYRVVYDNGFKSWEWDKSYQIRSYSLILPYIIYFYVLKLLNCDFTLLIVNGPSIIQAIITAISDSCLYIIMNKFTQRYLIKDNDNDNNNNNKSNKFWNSLPSWCLITHLCSWSWSFMGCRTLANTLETSLLLIINKLLLCDKQYFWSFLSLGYICYSRPTAVIPTALTISAYYYHIITTTLQKNNQYFLLESAIEFLINSCKFVVVFLIGSSICMIIDCYCTNQYNFSTFWNFYKFNIRENKAEVFGVQEWHWYFQQGIPAILGLYSCIFVSIIGVILYKGHNNNNHDNHNNNHQDKASTVMCTVFQFSSLLPTILACVSSHKEIRFLLPMLPALHCILVYLVFLLDNNNNNNSGNSNNNNNNNNEDSKIDKKSNKSWTWKRGLIVCWVVHVLIVMYLGSRHQAGPQTASKQLRHWINQRLILHTDRHTDRVETTRTRNRKYRKLPSEVYLLGQCYSFPGLAFLHPGATLGQHMRANPNYIQTNMNMNIKRNKNDGPSQVDTTAVVVRAPECWPIDISINKSSESDSDIPDRNCNSEFIQNPLKFLQRRVRSKRLITRFYQWFMNRNTKVKKWKKPFAVAVMSGHMTNELESFLLQEVGLVFHSAVHHTDFRYDYDDPLVHKQVLLYVYPSLSLSQT